MSAWSSIGSEGGLLCTVAGTGGDFADADAEAIERADFELGAFALDVFALDVFALEAFALAAFALEAFALEAFALEAFALEAFPLEAFKPVASGARAFDWGVRGVEARVRAPCCAFGLAFRLRAPADFAFVAAIGDGFSAAFRAADSELPEAERTFGLEAGVAVSFMASCGRGLV
jgi:hypothetical protein